MGSEPPTSWVGTREASGKQLRRNVVGRGSRARDGRAVIDDDVNPSPLPYGGLESSYDHSTAVKPDGSEAQG